MKENTLVYINRTKSNILIQTAQLRHFWSFIQGKLGCLGHHVLRLMKLHSLDSKISFPKNITRNVMVALHFDASIPRLT